MKNNKLQTENFYPLTLTRSVGELRCGAVTIGERKRKHPIEFPWDLIKHLKEDLEEDLRVVGSRVIEDKKNKIHPTAVIYAPEKVLIEEGVEIEACAVLDARQGPIYIGRGSIIKAGANLRGPLSIGPECRIGGEVTHSIFHGYSNKAHYGFIGHSYIGEWVNLGAGTTNSNLKNTYGSVKINLQGKEIDSKEQFLGCFIADFAKLGIGTMIPTGAVVGVGANLFNGGMIPKVVNNFAWGEKGKYRLEEFIQNTERMMQRRGKALEKGIREKLKQIHAQLA